MKKLIAYALHQPLFIILGTLLFVMSGVFAFKNLSVEAFPDVTDTQVTVIALFPGRAAEEVEKQVTLPIETALSGLPNSIRLFSHTQFGLSYTVITYDDAANVNIVRQQVNERLGNVDLPNGAQVNVAPNATPVGEVRWFGESPALPCSPMVIRSSPVGVNLRTTWFPSSVVHTFPSRSMVRLWGNSNSPTPHEASSFPSGLNFMIGGSLRPSQEFLLQRLST